MLVASCPHCGDSVTVPERARPASRARCPLCAAEFTLAEIFDKLPPTLELLDEPLTASSAATHTAEVGGAGNVATLVAEGDMTLADAEPRAERPSYLDDAGVSTAPRSGVKSTPRPKKAKKNMALEMVKVVLGGVAAIPISQLILWWAAGTDPFNAGPMIAQNAPFLAFAVPEKLRGKEKSGDNGEKNTAKKTAKRENPADDPRMPKLERGGFADIDPNKPKESLDATDPLDPATTLPMDDPLMPPDKGLEIAPLIPPGDDPVEPPADPTPTKPAKLGVKNAPQYTASELGESLTAAKQALQMFDEGYADADTEEKRKLWRGLYKALAELSEKQVFLANQDDSGPELLDVQEFVRDVEGKDLPRGLVRSAGVKWLTFSVAERGTRGVMLIGRITAIEPQTGWSKVTLELEDADKTTVTILDERHPADLQLKQDERVNYLGAIIDSPATELTGYNGQDQVIFSRLGFRMLKQTE
jgi:hypothetical protein